MNQDRNVFQLAVPCGIWFGVQVRISIWFVLVFAALCSRLGDVTLGLTVGAIMFLSVLLHEFGHVLGARRTGGSADEVHITPFGGLALCIPASTFASRFITTLMGPMTNLAICVLTFYPLLKSQYSAGWYNPFEIPAVVLKGKALANVMPELLVLAFKVNWVLLLINLLPVHPLDGGRLLLMGLTAAGDAQVARNRYLVIGSYSGIAFMCLGLIYGSVWVMLIGAVVMAFNMQEQFRMQVSQQDESDASFMGYDFSEGYTSLERSHEAEEPSPGMLERWKQQREEELRRRKEEEDRQLSRTLDGLLEKLHAQGEDALTTAEKRQLQQISAKFRERNRGQ